MDLCFRHASGTDIAVLAAIISSSEAWTCYGIDHKQAVVLLEEMEDVIYIAEQDKQLLGFITLIFNGVGNFGAYVRMLAVAEPYRGKGVGRCLIDYASKIVAPNQPNLFLICSTENLSAQRFYANSGFEEVGLLKDLVIAGHDEILYRKRYSPSQFKTGRDRCLTTGIISPNELLPFFTWYTLCINHVKKGGLLCRLK